jgi:hypothetical protein
VDGAFYANNRCGATSAILCDHQGLFLGLHQDGIPTLTMEALACQDGVVLVQSVGAHNLCIETDCEDLCEAIYGK